MGFFNKPESTPSLVSGSDIAPLTRSRIEAHLTGEGWNFGIDPDGDVVGQWDDNVLYFLTIGDSLEILKVQGRWKHTFPAERETELLHAINEFNRGLVWPKLWVGVDEGQAAVYTEVSTDLEHGVSDAQLGQLINCGLFSTLNAFSRLGAALGLPEE